MTRQTKALYLLRHAKSAWDTDAADDFSRPLNPRGKRDTKKMGQWMAQQGLFPRCIVSSPALRTWQTITTVCHILGIDSATVNFDRRVYLADVSDLCQVISATDEDVDSLLLVGHNPGLELLIEHLVTAELPVSPGGKLLPTATLCILHLSSWHELKKGSAQLSLIKRPKKSN